MFDKHGPDVNPKSIFKHTLKRAGSAQAIVPLDGLVLWEDPPESKGLNMTSKTTLDNVVYSVTQSTSNR